QAAADFEVFKEAVRRGLEDCGFALSPEAPFVYDTEVAAITPSCDTRGFAMALRQVGAEAEFACNIECQSLVYEQRLEEAKKVREEEARRCSEIMDKAESNQTVLVGDDFDSWINCSISQSYRADLESSL